MFFPITKRSDIKLTLDKFCRYTYWASQPAIDAGIDPLNARSMIDSVRQALDQAIPEYERWRINALANYIREKAGQGMIAPDIAKEKYYKDVYRELTYVMDKHILG